MRNGLGAWEGGQGGSAWQTPLTRYKPTVRVSTWWADRQEFPIPRMLIGCVPALAAALGLEKTETPTDLASHTHHASNPSINNNHHIRHPASHPSLGGMGRVARVETCSKRLHRSTGR